MKVLFSCLQSAVATFAKQTTLLNTSATAKGWKFLLHLNFKKLKKNYALFMIDHEDLEILTEDFKLVS